MRAPISKLGIGHPVGVRPHSGRLDVVATPIGNLSDLSTRARESLASADVIAAEDTRRTLGLLQALGLSRPIMSLHAHNEARRLPDLLARLQAGEVVALVTDAGTPLLSDPGSLLVQSAASAGIEVRSIPGPSAITSALVAAGLPTDRFCFEGFLPAAERERRERLGELAAERRTLVFFEAPHRIAAALVDFATVFGAERPAAVARELTKAHETIYRGALGELAARARDDENFQRGELTIVVHGASADSAPTNLRALRRAVELLAKELPPGKAAALAAELTGATRQEAYAIALEIKQPAK
jgi:16S rRNA (cytidine1402-2'-O)-methyltransferase